MKIGTLAQRTGLTVRTLHYYEEIGLLLPAGRTDAGHRRYGPAEVVRLQQILSLRQLGFSLDDIRTFLDRPDASVQHIIALHLARLREQMDIQQRLHQRLERLAAHVRSAEEVSVETFIETIQMIVMHETYYSQDQLDTLKARAEQLGEEQIRAYEAEWATLIDQVRTAMNDGLDPASELVQRLAARWQELIEAFTGCDVGMRQSLQTMYKQEGPEKASRGMLDQEVLTYISRAIASIDGAGTQWRTPILPAAEKHSGS